MLSLAEDYAPAGEVVGREFYSYTIAGQYADEVLAHFAGDMAEHFPVRTVDLELEHGVGQRRYYGGLNFYRLGFTH